MAEDRNLGLCGSAISAVGTDLSAVCRDVFGTIVPGDCAWRYAALGHVWGEKAGVSYIIRY